MDRAKMPIEQQNSVAPEEDSLVPQIRLFQASALFGSSKEIGIVHDGALYRLRVTRAGKLILTK